MPPIIDIEIGDVLPPAAILQPPRRIVSKTSKPRTALPDRPNQVPKKLSDRQQDTAKTLSDRPAKPQSAPKSPPERLLQTMDELDLYREWSRLKKSMVERAKANPGKVRISFPCYWHEGEVEKARMLQGWQGEYKTNTQQPALRAFFNERQAKIGMTEDQIRRFKKLVSTFSPPRP